jgi:hypothetical protein
VLSPTFRSQQHEAAAAEVPGRWVDYRESKSSGDRCVHGIAPRLHHFHAGARGELVDARHHTVIGYFRVHPAASERDWCDQDCEDEGQRCMRSFQHGSIGGSGLLRVMV